MAISKENDLIGYDPLAWMEGDNDKNEDHLVTDDIDSDNTQEGATCDTRISMTDDYSDVLKGNAEESAILSALSDAEGNVAKEAESAIDELENENDSALIEEMVNDSVSEETDGSLIDLDATLTIQNVVKLHEKLKNCLAVHDEIEINASDVSSIDTATLQLLVSLKKDTVKLQKQVTIIYPSPRFVESAKLLGLLNVLDVHDV